MFNHIWDQTRVRRGTLSWLISIKVLLTARTDSRCQGQTRRAALRPWALHKITAAQGTKALRVIGQRNFCRMEIHHIGAFLLLSFPYARWEMTFPKNVRTDRRAFVPKRDKTTMWPQRKTNAGSKSYVINILRKNKKLSGYWGRTGSDNTDTVFTPCGPTELRLERWRLNMSLWCQTYYPSPPMILGSFCPRQLHEKLKPIKN